jgi:DNA modification methylase
MVCTSPPYWALRSYLDADHEHKAYELGSEATPAEYIANMVQVFEGVRRVLRRDGLCFVNIGDSYGAGTSAKREQSRTHNEGRRTHLARTIPRNGSAAKQLCLIPQRLAIALQDRGWYVRQEIAWCKKAPMPESVTDRFTSAHEKILMLSKSPNYYFDQEAVKEPSAWPEGSREDVPQGGFNGKGPIPGSGQQSLRAIRNTRNMRNFWLLGPEPFAQAHFATFPTEIPRRCISVGTSERGCCADCQAPWRRVVEKSGGTTGKGWHDHKADITNGMSQVYRADGGDTPYTVTTTGWAPTCTCPTTATVPATVLDPFCGAATTLLVALRLGRRGLGIELNPEYIAMSHKRIAEDEGANQMHMALEA